MGKITIIISHTTAKVKRFGAERTIDNLHIISYNICRLSTRNIEKITQSGMLCALPLDFREVYLVVLPRGLLALFKLAHQPQESNDFSYSSGNL